MIHIADCLKILPEDTARYCIARDPATKFGQSLRFQWIENQSFKSTPTYSPNQHTQADDCKSTKQPRQAMVTSNRDKLLPLEQCQTCKKMKRRVTFRYGECSECQIENFKTHCLDHHLLSIKKKMDRQDRASYPAADNNGPLYSDPVPIWEQCCFCESISGSDGLCNGCGSSNDPSYAVEHTNIPTQLWWDLLADQASHLE